MQVWTPASELQPAVLRCKGQEESLWTYVLMPMRFDAPELTLPQEYSAPGVEEAPAELPAKKAKPRRRRKAGSA